MGHIGRADDRDCGDPVWMLAQELLDHEATKRMSQQRQTLDSELVENGCEILGQNADTDTVSEGK